MTGDELAAEGGFRRATYLELFLDLAFVFAVTEIAVLISADLSVRSFLHGTLVAWLVWWLWSQFAWTGTAVDLQADRFARVLVIAAIPAVLVLAVSIPHAFDEGTSAGTARPFGVAYLLADAVGFLILGRAMWAHPARRASFLGYVGFAGIGPVVAAVGGFLDVGPRRVAWIVAAALGVIGAISAGIDRGEASRQWVIDPGHFSERHALFVIIVLGEVLVAAGGTAYGTVEEHGLAGETIAGLVAVTAVAGALWWMYFAYVPTVTEGALARSSGPRRMVVARDVLTFGHFPLVLGVIAFAVVAKHTVVHPGEHLEVADRWVLGVSMVLVIGGFMVMHFMVNRGVVTERAILLAALPALIAAAGPWLAGGLMLAGLAAVLVGVHAVTVSRLARRMAAEEVRRGGLAVGQD